MNQNPRVEIPLTRPISPDYKKPGLNRTLTTGRTESDMLAGQGENVEGLEPLPEEPRELVKFVAEIYELGTPLSYLPTATTRQLKVIGDFVQGFMKDRGYKENVGTFKKVLAEKIEEELGFFREDMRTDALLEKLFAVARDFSLIKEPSFKEERAELWQKLTAGGELSELKELILEFLEKAKETKRAKKKRAKKQSQSESPKSNAGFRWIVKS